MDQPLRRPFLVGTVGRRHVLVQRGEAAAPGTAAMAGHTLATVQHLDQGIGDASLQHQPHQPHQRVRHAVAVGLVNGCQDALFSGCESAVLEVGL